MNTNICGSVIFYLTLTCYILYPGMPALEITLVEIEDSCVKIQWSSVNGAKSYKISKRIEHSEWLSREVNTHEVSFPDLQPGTTYEFKVCAISITGEGEESVVLRHTTGL